VAKAHAEYPELVCQTVVNQNIKIEEAQVAKQSIFSYASEDRGAQQYQALTAELLGRLGA
jgi:cellulose biosynthesis protein BcsQ